MKTTVSPDAEWAAFVARGEAAKEEVPGELAGAQAAYRALLTALETDGAAIQVRLKRLNEALIAA